LPETEAAFASVSDQEQQPLRIGWLTNAWKQISPAVQQPLAEARSVLEKSGAQVKDAALPEGPWEAAAGVVLGAEVASAFDEFIESGKISQLTDPEGRIGGYVNQQIAGADLVRANRIRRVAQKKMQGLFQNFDVVATASLPVLASKITANLDDELTFPDPLGGIGNFCGLPAVSIPCGFSGGLPIGLQFVGPALGEHQTLRAASLFQQHTDWHRRRPKL
jgi:aspartyl-tRNA(Asn)/glutamyl-tRNA(Gln) amidotransferase subunit A